jgi:hypothetical protein
VQVGAFRFVHPAVASPILRLLNPYAPRTVVEDYGDAAATAQWRPRGPALGALIAQKGDGSGDLARFAAAEVADRIRSIGEAPRVALNGRIAENFVVIPLKMTAKAVLQIASGDRHSLDETQWQTSTTQWVFIAKGD